ncbi:MAG: hypothetical protein K8T89_03720 [Planctomycetes bacterium]|nr:hypothetical protein [Planctomycetota bacterium]
MSLSSTSLAVLLFGALTALPLRGQNVPTETPIAPRTITFTMEKATAPDVAAAIAKQTGMEVDLTAVEGKMPASLKFNRGNFWDAVEFLAVATDSRVVIGSQGKPVRLVPLNGGLRNPVSIAGPFRVAAREVDTRLDLQTGKAVYDLTIDVAWESRLPVYRMDAYPRISRAFDDAGRPITVKPFTPRTPVSGVQHSLRVPLDGLSRQSKEIAVLKGTLTATVAEELLRIEFDADTPAAKKEKGVEVALKKFVKQGAFWFADIQLIYPAHSAVFESFETYWLSRNRFTLIAPDGKTKFTTEDYEEVGNQLRYRFKEGKDFKPKDLKGWKVEYQTPGVTREKVIEFELKGISLP